MAVLKFFEEQAIKLYYTEKFFMNCKGKTYQIDDTWTLSWSDYMYTQIAYELEVTSGCYIVNTSRRTYMYLKLNKALNNVGK